MIVFFSFEMYSRAYKPANQYMDFFVSPLAAVSARFVTFIAGSILGVLILLSGTCFLGYFKYFKSDFCE